MTPLARAVVVTLVVAVAWSGSLDGAGNHWAERINGGATTSFDLDLASSNPTILADGTKKYLPGDPAAGYDSGGTWWSSVANLIGSPIEYVSPTGTTTTPVHYDPYGVPRPGSASPTEIGFAGEWTDPSGLVNLRARAYDPVTGRFVGRDTFGGVASAPQTANRYAYATLNPLRYSDPSGHFVQAAFNFAPTVIQFALLTNPVTATIFAVYGAVTGTDPFSGRKLTDGERLGSLVLGVALPLGAAALFKVTRGMGSHVDDVAGLGREGRAAEGAGGDVIAGERAGGNAVGGLTDNSIYFGQRSVRRTFTTVEEGSTFRYAAQSVADVASGLRRGVISPDDLRIEYVVRGGQRIAINNRSLLALRRAGLDPTATIDITGDALAESKITQRLSEMGGQPATTIRVRGAGPTESYLDWLSW